VTSTLSFIVHLLSPSRKQDGVALDVLPVEEKKSASRKAIDVSTETEGVDLKPHLFQEHMC